MNSCSGISPSISGDYLRFMKIPEQEVAGNVSNRNSGCHRAWYHIVFCKLCMYTRERNVTTEEK